MVLTGCGVGIMMQNLVLCAQSQVGLSEVGSARSTVTFFRSLGGAVGVSVLGSVPSSRISHHARKSIGSLGPRDRLVAATASADGAVPDPQALPATVRAWLERAYGHGIGDIFLYCAPLVCVAFVVTLLIRENTLRATHGPHGRAGAAERVPAVGTGHGDPFRRLPEGSGAVDGVAPEGRRHRRAMMHVVCRRASGYRRPPSAARHLPRPPWASGGRHRLGRVRRRRGHRVCRGGPATGQPRRR